VYKFDSSKSVDADIALLFERCLGGSRPGPEWNWRYSDNPFNEPVTVLAESDPPGKLLGHQAITPVLLNLRGRAVLGGQSGDTMVEPSSRRLGIFREMLIASHVESEKKCMTLIYGFPGPMSLPGFLQRAGWLRVFFMDEFFVRLDRLSEFLMIARIRSFASALNSTYRIWIKFLTNIAIYIGKSRMDLPKYHEEIILPDDYDEFWSHVARYEVYSVWKNSKYMAWRYDRNPAHRYRYHCLRKNARLMALVVTRTENGVTQIAEFMFREKNLEWARYLLLEIKAFALKSNAARLSFMAHDSGFFWEAFRSFSHRILHEQVFCLVPLKESASYPGIELPGNWTITAGDWDGI
jgi:hypothetical protein